MLAIKRIKAYDFDRILNIFVVVQDSGKTPTCTAVSVCIFSDCDFKHWTLKFQYCITAPCCNTFTYYTLHLLIDVVSTVVVRYTVLGLQEVD